MFYLGAGSQSSSPTDPYPYLSDPSLITYFAPATLAFLLFLEQPRSAPPSESMHSLFSLPRMCFLNVATKITLSVSSDFCPHLTFSVYSSMTFSREIAILLLPCPGMSYLIFLKTHTIYR